MVISGARRPPLWAWCVGLALISSAVSGLLFLLAIDGHLTEIFHIERLVDQAPENAELFRWAMILDMLGDYVLLAPRFVAVGRHLMPARAPPRGRTHRPRKRASPRRRKSSA